MEGFPDATQNKRHEGYDDKSVRIKLKWDAFYNDLERKLEEANDTERSEIRKKLAQIQEQIAILEKKVKSTGLEPKDYLARHILVGSSPERSPDMMEFDTPYGDFEKLIDEIIG